MRALASCGGCSVMTPKNWVKPAEKLPDALLQHTTICVSRDSSAGVSIFVLIKS